MRDILFRAKRLDNGEWALSRSIAENLKADGQRTYLIGAKQPAILSFNEKGNTIAAETTGEALFYAVDPDTIGQYTGQNMKDGIKIFEGDIVLVNSGYVDEEDGYAVVVWDEGTSRFILEWRGFVSDFDSFYGYECEVVGNIYDNPELMKEED